MENLNKKQKMSVVCPSCNEDHFEGHRCLTLLPELESSAEPSSEAQPLPPLSESVTSNVESGVNLDHASGSVSESVSRGRGQEDAYRSSEARLLQLLSNVLQNNSEGNFDQASLSTYAENHRERSQATLEVQTPTETHQEAQFSNEESNLVMASAPRRVGVSEDDCITIEDLIESIPFIPVTREHLDKMDQCPICLEHFDIGESVRKLICDHIFHDQCIKPWLRMNDDCPVCRRYQQLVPTYSREYFRRVNMQFTSTLSSFLVPRIEIQSNSTFEERLSNYFPDYPEDSDSDPVTVTILTYRETSDGQRITEDVIEISDDEAPTTT